MKTKFLEKNKANKRETVNDLPPYLRGASQNRWGGHKAQRLRFYGELGPASEGRSLTGEEFAAAVAKLEGQ